MDFAAAGLLDGLEGVERASREELLATLVSEGYTLEELAAAIAEDRLALLPLERVLGARYTAAEAADRAGVPVALLARFRRQLGLPQPDPEERLFSEEDVDAARSTKMFLASGLSEDAIVEITRVLGESMARLAATTTAAFVEAFLEPGDSEQDVARRFASLAQELTPAINPVLAAAYGAHLRESVGRGMIGSEERAAGRVAGAQEVAVCFADLVGFTRLGGEVEVQELGNVAGQLARLATEVSEPPVRLVKTIGDAAMFVSPEPAPLVAAALSLTEAVEQAEMPPLRAGIALGPAYLRSGDFYGHSVNIASRVTGVARPGSVLCSSEVHDAAAEEFDWSFAGRFRLKGVHDPAPLFRAHRLSANEPNEPQPARRPTRGRSRKRASS
ncbi:MAG TPA: adenylate cyclase regulatory domain-containing protein [Solirubrobacteraceae bacterium]|nr:adenylate cyclase regulatory domain-containing protein [Solirubrobacteraceae bacterium]